MRNFSFILSLFFGLFFNAVASGKTSLSTDPVFWSESTSFAIRGKQYELLKRTNQQGAVTEQILITDDRMIISSDPHGRGSLESWQLITPTRAVLMREPRNGKFQFMDVVEQGPKAILEMKFVALKSGEYKIYSATSRPYKRQFAESNYQDYVVGCRASEKPIQELAANVNEMLTTDSNNLRGSIKSQLMNPSCSDPAGPFNGESVNAMVDGVMKVASSDPQWNNAKMSSLNAIYGGQKSVDQKGSFLQCMRYYKLDTHASRIEAAFASYMDKVKQDWKFYWRIDCKQDANPKVDGSFDQTPGAAPTISFFKTAKELVKKPGQSLSDAYAETFFHEMIHYSLIANEDVVSDIEHCCSPGGDQKSCKSLEERIQNKLYGQQFENQFAAKLGDKYAAYRDIITANYGPGANQVMDDFFTDAGSAYAKQVARPECKKPDGTAGLSAACETEFKNTFAKLADDTFGSGPDSACTKSTARGATARTLENVGYADSTGNSGNKGLDKMTAKQADGFCSELAYFSKDVFDVEGLGSPTASPCPDNKKNKATAWYNNFPLDRGSPALSWLIYSERAQAYESDTSINQLCDMPISNQAYSFQLNNSDFSKAPDAPPSSKQIPDAQQHNDAASDSASQPLPHTSSGANIGYQNQPSGPRRPDYSPIPSEREIAIYKELQRQDNTFGSRFSQLSDRLARSVEVAAKANDNGTPLTLVQIRVPDMKLPAPLAPGPDPAISSFGRASAANAAASNSNFLGSNSTKNINSTASSISNFKAVNASGASSSGKAGAIAKAGTNRGIAGSTAGIGASAAGAAAAAVTKDKKSVEAEARARKALIAFLQGPYRRVKPELERPSVRERLMYHKIQVVDDDGQVFGPKNFIDQLVYNINKNSLVLMRRPARTAAGQ